MKTDCPSRFLLITLPADANTTLIGSSVIIPAVAVNNSFSSIDNVSFTVQTGASDQIRRSPAS